MIRRLLIAALLSAPLAACQTAQQQPAAGDSAWYIGAIQDKPFNIPLVDRRKMEPPSTPARRWSTKAPRRQARSWSISTSACSTSSSPRAGRSATASASAGRASPGRALRRSVARACGRTGRPPRPWSASSRNCRATSRPASKTRSAPAPSTCTRTARDTLFRIHGTNEPWTIGEQVSSGCVRMLNEDVADLYERVPVGTTVYVKRNGRYRV